MGQRRTSSPSTISDSSNNFRTCQSNICVMAPQTHLLLTALFAIGHALPNLPQITPAPSIAHLEAKRATDSGNGTLVGYYTESEGGAWQTNTCGESATWSTSGKYGACAGKAGQSLYTSCSGNVLVGAGGSTTQSW